MNFEQSLTLAGLIPRDIVADGRIRRCRTELKPGKRNGWYVLHPDGHGAWGDWTSGSGEALGHWNDDRATHGAVSAETQARMQRQREQERKARIQAMRSARDFWDRARPLSRPHPYIERKGLSPLGCGGLRQHDGLLVIPVRNGEWITSIQTITPEGEKRFWPGAPVKGGHHIIQREKSALVAFCEGLATGLAVYQSVRAASVVVAFDAGNLLPSLQTVKPSGAVVFCADNDHGTQARRGMNPGLEKARNAAELVGAGVAWPTGIEGTDWADALAEYGQGGAKKIERQILAGARYVVNTS